MIFDLAYTLHWGYTELYELPLHDLYLYHALLVRQRKREQEEANRSAGRKR